MRVSGGQEMTEEINYQALFEQVQAENEALREKLTKFRLAKFDMDSVINIAREALHNGYFWLGYFVALIVMLSIGVFRKGYA
ncbi:MAG: hypothetical protein KGL95_15710 [Patescibacteria group bacterium]|nr:hypothetical protein [Patescibacteria group bacterium]